MKLSNLGIALILADIIKILLTCSLFFGSPSALAQDSIGNQALQNLLNGFLPCNEECLENETHLFLTCSGQSFGGYYGKQAEDQWFDGYKLTTNDVNVTLKSTRSEESKPLLCRVSEAQYQCQLDYTEDSGRRTVNKVLLDRITGGVTATSRWYSAKDREKIFYHQDAFGKCQVVNKQQF